jgi:uroporphyrin-III C-methyltransferase / precorrin-2 dehydrogenase / sirohydrochlorin ferrochelatase
MRPTSPKPPDGSAGLNGHGPGMDYLPVFLHLQGRPAVLVGGGRVAARKAELLRRSGALLTVVAPELVEELQQLRDSGELRHLAAEFEPAQLQGAAVVVAATSKHAVNRAVAIAARAGNIPVNVVDDPQNSSFIFPAIIDRSPIIVAVSSGGHAPVLARSIRERLEALLPARVGALARFMGERRTKVGKALSQPARRPFWERVVNGIVGARVLAGEEIQAEAAFERELRTSQLTGSAATGGRSLGECYLIGAGPGDPDLLTLRALQLLQQADVILYDRLVPAAVLERARRDAQRVFVGKQSGQHTVQERINSLLVDYARQGLRVARLKGGDPYIFGRGGEEAEVLAAHGIPFVVIPGITAALGAAAMANIPLTHRKLSQSVTFVTGHALEDDSLDWNALARRHQTVVFYMGVGHLPQIAGRLRSAGSAADHPVAVIERATLPEQRIIRGTLSDIAQLCEAAGVTPPALLVIGEVTTVLAEGAGSDPAVPLASWLLAEQVPA